VVGCQQVSSPAQPRCEKRLTRDLSFQVRSETVVIGASSEQCRCLYVRSHGARTASWKNQNGSALCHVIQCHTPQASARWRCRCVQKSWLQARSANMRNRRLWYREVIEVRAYTMPACHVREPVTAAYHKQDVLSVSRRTVTSVLPRYGSAHGRRSPDSGEEHRCSLQRDNALEFTRSRFC